MNVAAEFYFTFNVGNFAITILHVATDAKRFAKSIGHAFKFDDWEGGEVAFVSTFVRQAKPNSDDEKCDADGGLMDLRNWLADNM